MKNSLIVLISFVIISFSFNSEIISQDYGKIFTSTEADSLFGTVQMSYTIEDSVLISLLQKTKKVVMFKFINEKLIILGEKRRQLFGSVMEIDNDTVFHMFSVEKVLQLLEMGGSDSSTIERRVEVLSITNGNFTLEMSQPCPPYCP